MNRRAIAALALAVAGGGVVLAPGPDKGEIEKASDRSARSLESQARGAAAKLAQGIVGSTFDAQQGVTLRHGMMAVVVDSDGKELVRTAIEGSSSSPTTYSLCYIAKSVAHCKALRGDECRALEAWSAYMPGDTVLPDPADCE